jgi:hypothetical protein
MPESAIHVDVTYGIRGYVFLRFWVQVNRVSWNVVGCVVRAGSERERARRNAEKRSRIGRARLSSLPRTLARGSEFGVFRKTRRVRPAESGGRTCEGEQRAGARHGAVGVGEREVQRLCAWEDGGGDPSVSRRCAIGGG